MNDKIKNIILTVVLSVFIFGFGAYLLVAPPTEYSDSERRVLAKFPELSSKTLLNGSFMTDFETFTLDQFPLRDTFRRVKMFTALRVFNNLTANDLYTWDGAVVKQEYPLTHEVVLGNLATVEGVYEKNIAGKGANVYFSLVPDKNYYFADLAGRLSFDWKALEKLVAENADYAEYIDITSALNKDSYYLTDTHWSQDKIIDTAEKIAQALGKHLPDEYTEHTLDKDFYGVYTGQLMLPVTPDKIVYLRNDVIDSYEVKSLSSNGILQDDEVYNFDKISSKDLYDFFMSGAVPLVIVDNPTVTDGSHLIIFRDSFGSSMAPLLAQAYSKTTVIDLRYINPAFLSSFTNFENSDVLFMYSPLVLNSPAVLQG
jgi:hypothetical protein